jgi:hypothetical protein
MHAHQNVHVTPISGIYMEMLNGEFYEVNLPVLLLILYFGSYVIVHRYHLTYLYICLF